MLIGMAPAGISISAPEAAKVGLDLYESNYGTVESGWSPSGC